MAASRLPTLLPADLMHTIQVAQIYDDSKTFVDQPLKVSPTEAILSFPSPPTPTSLKIFVADNYDPPDCELEVWRPADFAPEIPPELSGVEEGYRGFAAFLHGMWPELGRRTVAEVSTQPDRHSLLPRKNGFIIPGGRFRENYYWDSYWIVRGLLVSNMTETVKGMLNNFLEDVRDFGHVPNGGRRYYTSRSQPPLLTLSLCAYIDVTEDFAFAAAAMPGLLEEMRYWRLGHGIRVRTGAAEIHMLFQYRSPEATPRPESYTEDIATAGVAGKPFRDALADTKAQTIWRNIRGAAESGWDFSSRWRNPATARGEFDLSQTNHDDCIPVDLNAVILQSLVALADLVDKLRAAGFEVNVPPDEDPRKLAQALRQDMFTVLYDSSTGLFVDAWLRPSSEWVSVEREVEGLGMVTAASATAAWAGLYEDLDDAAKGALRDLLTLTSREDGKPVLRGTGGILTTWATTGQQWDSPNAWPPLQDFAVVALERMGFHAEASALAREWLASVKAAWDDTGAMWEKMDALRPGVAGGGGEYDIQTGFGWSNGVAAVFLRDYASGGGASPSAEAQAST